MDQSDTERSLNTIYGEGYVYMGPLTPQHYQISSNIQQDNSSTDNQYQFKVMLLGDSGVGKSRFHFHSLL
jgi:polynucleotide 5'-kinase involved in rRNA processing